MYICIVFQTLPQFYAMLCHLCQTNQFLNEVLIKLFVIVCHIHNILSYTFTKTFLHNMPSIDMYEVDLRLTQTAQRQYLETSTPHPWRYDLIKV